MDDKDIVQLFLSRDSNAINQADIKYGSALEHIACNILNSKEDAKEIHNDTLLGAWNTIPPNEPKYLFAYMAKICRNLAYNRVDWNNAAKRNANIVELTNELEKCISGNYSGINFEAVELGEVMERFIVKLPERKRAIFIQRYWFSQSVKEISEKFGYSVTYVNVVLFRIRKDLKNFY